MSVSGGMAPGRLDLSDEAIARSILALQRESSAVEAALIAVDPIPVLTDTFEELRGRAPAG